MKLIVIQLIKATNQQDKKEFFDVLFTLILSRFQQLSVISTQKALCFFSRFSLSLSLSSSPVSSYFIPSFRILSLFLHLTLFFPPNYIRFFLSSVFLDQRSIRKKLVSLTFRTYFKVSFKLHFSVFFNILEIFFWS